MPQKRQAPAESRWAKTVVATQSLAAMSGLETSWGAIGAAGPAPVTGPKKRLMGPGEENGSGLPPSL